MKRQVGSAFFALRWKQTLFTRGTACIPAYSPEPFRRFWTCRRRRPLLPLLLLPTQPLPLLRLCFSSCCRCTAATAAAATAATTTAAAACPLPVNLAENTKLPSMLRKSSGRLASHFYMVAGNSKIDLWNELFRMFMFMAVALAAENSNSICEASYFVCL